MGAVKLATRKLDDVKAIVFLELSAADELRVHSAWSCPKDSERVQCAVAAGVNGSYVSLLDKHLFRSGSILSRNISFIF